MKRYGTVGWISIILIFTLVATVYGQSQKTTVVTPSRGSADALRDEIVAHERAGLDALKTGDLTLFGASTAEDAVFVDAHGPATKAEVMEHTAGFRLKDYTMEDVRFVRLSAESGLIAYTITESGTSHGHDFNARVYVSALWVKRGGKWMCVFSQETGAK
jgi:Domain of unknown function (DUF4440)